MYRIVLDTEFSGAVQNYKTTRVYDFGFVVINENYEVVDSRNYVVRETWEHEPLMAGAYYADKLVSYREEIAAGIRTVKPMREIYAEFLTICKDYRISQVWAYNADADRNALNNTIYEASNHFITEFLPQGVEWCDAWNMATHTLCNSKRFYQFVADNGMTKASGNCPTNAETVYAFISGNAEFVECHTGLEDAIIEAAILAACLKRHTKQHKEICCHAWRVPQKGFKEYMQTR